MYMLLYLLKENLGTFKLPLKSLNDQEEVVKRTFMTALLLTLV